MAAARKPYTIKASEVHVTLRVKLLQQNTPYSGAVITSARRYCLPDIELARQRPAAMPPSERQKGEAVLNPSCRK